MPFLDALLTKGGMSSMLNTVWLIICGAGFRRHARAHRAFIDFLLRMALKTGE
jgi:NhaC family Na+:H+ antiporter